MTDMEQAIEKAARTIHAGHCCPCDLRGCYEPDPEDYNAARALASAGLLAPAPLTEEWGAEMDHPTPDSPPSTIKARDLENARWQVEHNPKVATGRIMHRYVSDWEHAEL